MSYVIYHKESTVFLTEKHFQTLAAAKAARTKICNAGKQQKGTSIHDYEIAESTEFYKNIEKDVVVHSLMTGSPVTIKANTPWCCNPSSETYWSM